jgi:alpha-1,6-mannosyltransferase
METQIPRLPAVRFSIALLAEILLFAALNRYDDWTLEAMPVKFVTAALFCGMAYLIAVTPFTIFDNLRSQAVIFWSAAVLLRLIALPLAPSDDLWRYQWEGKIQRAGFNPYLNAPDDSRLESLRADFPEWHRINHREYRVVYPPGAELLFNALNRISDRPLFYKLLFAAADFATMGVLLSLIGGRSRYSQAAWYAWNPLVVYSFAGAAHFDSLMILPMTAGILFLSRSVTEPDSLRKWLLALAAATAFGLAISLKLIPALLLLVCIWPLGVRALALVISLALPVLFGCCYGLANVVESLGRFVPLTRLNDLFWWLIEDTYWENTHQRNYHYNVVLLVCILLVSLIFIRNWKRGMLWVLGTVLILSPVLHPWYCAWILPLATWRRTYAWHVLSVTLFVYYLFWNERIFALPWHAELWMRGMIIIPALLATLSGLARNEIKSSSLPASPP